MKNKIFTGVGCFAKPARLGRIFSKLVQNYALGSFNGNRLFDGTKPIDREGSDLLQALMTGQPAGSTSGSYESHSLNGPRKITGFYLFFNNQKLNLSIFARGNNRRQEVYTTSLDEITKVRKRRLN